MRRAPESLRSERLLIRPYTESDIAAILSGLNDLEVSRRLQRVPFPYRESHARALLARATDARAAGTMYSFGIERVSDGRIVGGIGLDFGESADRASCGYWVARTEWGRGYAREALARVVRLAFHEVDPPASVVEAAVHLCNPASQRVLEACGFIEVGRDECPCAATGETLPALRYELRAHD